MLETYSLRMLKGTMAINVKNDGIIPLKTILSRTSPVKGTAGRCNRWRGLIEKLVKCVCCLKLVSIFFLFTGYAPCCGYSDATCR